MLEELLNADYYGGRMEKKEAYYKPSANVTESEKAYNIALSVPGYSKDEIKVKIENNVLTITSDEEAGNKVDYLLHEFSKRKFKRSFELPEGTEVGNIKATHDNGILNLSIPKKEKIEIPVQEIEVK